MADDTANDETGKVQDPPAPSDQGDGASGEGSGEGEAKPETASE